jgi:hypothetical protein
MFTFDITCSVESFSFVFISASVFSGLVLTGPTLKIISSCMAVCG